MRKISAILIFTGIAICSPATSSAQVNPSAGTGTSARTLQQHLIGEVTASNPATGQLTVKTDAGASIVVTADEKTIYRRLPPGQTSIDKAETITRADVRVGDRVLVPGGASATPTAARQVIVMAREAIAAKREQEREDWRARGTNGRVASIDANQKQLTIEARSREGAETINVILPSNVRFRRYAPGSLRPADAVSSSFADIRVGDQVRILGNREGSSVTAEEIISGRIARLVGVVEEVDASRRVVTVKENRTGRTVVVALTGNATVRRIPADFATEFRARGGGRRGGGAPSADGQAGERRGPRRDRTAQGGEGGQTGQDGERQRRGGRGLQGMLDSLPQLPLEELKKGDAVMVTGTSETDDSRVTAASLITGDAELLQRFGRGGGRPGEMSPGLPGGIVGGGTGEREP